MNRFWWLCYTAEKEEKPVAMEVDKEQEESGNSPVDKAVEAMAVDDEEEEKKVNYTSMEDANKTDKAPVSLPSFARHCSIWCFVI